MNRCGTKRRNKAQVCLIAVLSVIAVGLSVLLFVQQRGLEKIRQQTEAEAADIMESYGLELSYADVRGRLTTRGYDCTASYRVSDMEKLSTREMYQLAERLKNIRYTLKHDSGRV